MNRVVMGSVLVGLSAIYLPVSAMEFGPVRIHSKPDQPLQAEVSLRPQRPGELDHIQVSLAAADAFRRAGLDASAAGLPLQFSLREAGQGRQWLQISSSQPLSAADLDLLLVVSGPAGRSLHELPIVRVPEDRPASAAGRRSGPAAGGTAQSTVQAGQTLSSIAQAHRLQGVSLDQMLLAYQQANPQAFYAGNISALKTGAILRAPTRREVEAISRAAAFRAVAEQNHSWSAGRAIRPSTLANAAAAAPSPRPAPAPRTDRLALLAGHDQPGSKPGGSLEREALRVSQQQAAELASRIHDLQTMQQEREHLIDLKNQQIAQLQQQLQKAGRPASPPPPPAATTARPLPTPVPRPAATPPAGQGLNPWWLRGGAAGLVIVLLALAARGRRRRAPSAPTTVLPEAPLAPAAEAEPHPRPLPVEDPEQVLAALNEQLRLDPEDIDAYLQLARIYHDRHDVAHFVATAEALRGQMTDPQDPEWQEVARMGRGLLPAHPLFAAAEPVPAAAAGVASYAAVQQAVARTGSGPVAEPAPAPAPEPVSAAAPAPAPEPVSEPAPVAEPEAASRPVPQVAAAQDELIPERGSGAAAVPPAAAEHTAVAASSAADVDAEGLPAHADAVDTKLDLARAYLDMGVPASARAMLEEVLAEGSQMQKDVASQLLAGLPPV